VSAMRSHGLDETRLIAAGPPPISMREGAEAMHALLDTRPDTQAVICVSDLSAFGALTACQRRGIDVPGQISIAGFGNYEVGAISVPSITTVDPSPAQIGAIAAELLCKLELNPDTTAICHRIVPQLLLRESSV
jgi:LacI family transcriptional regulator, gluconate utilization system Gnt-I transcriptional repressor